MLAKMYKAGNLTQEEFQISKAKVLGIQDFAPQKIPLVAAVAAEAQVMGHECDVEASGQEDPSNEETKLTKDNNQYESIC